MAEFSKDRAAAGFWEAELAPENRRFVNYWLSLWDADELPLRQRYDPAQMRDLLPGIAIMEVKAAERVHIQIAGSALNAAFGFDLSGWDLATITREDDRPVRLARNSQIALGTAALALRRGRTVDGRDWTSEEVHLPFRDVLPDGVRLVLFHSTWRPDATGKPIIDSRYGLELVEKWQTIHLRS
jgi:hypothetical protein